MSESEIEKALIQTQKYYELTPVIVLGSGASAAFEMAGMWQLGQHLIKSIDRGKLEDPEKIVWDKFCEDLNNNIDLETALTNNRLPAHLTKEVIFQTWNLLNPQDHTIFKNSLSDQNFFPLGKMLKHLLRSTIRKVDIITTNYDRLAEYSCEQESIYYYTGFSQGYRGYEEPPETINTARKVNIWKVHGSLGWFKNDTSINISISNTNDLPNGLTPLIVTPGLDKYERATREPYRTLISQADRALTNSNAYLCIGYGFNDIHIQEKLINKCTRDHSKIIIITRTLTDAASNFLNSGEIHNHIVFTRGEDDNQTVIRSSELQAPITVNENYWSLAGFLRIIM